MRDPNAEKIFFATTRKTPSLAEVRCRRPYRCLQWRVRATQHFASHQAAKFTKRPEVQRPRSNRRHLNGHAPRLPLACAANLTRRKIVERTCLPLPFGVKQQSTKPGWKRNKLNISRSFTSAGKPAMNSVFCTGAPNDSSRCVLSLSSCRSPSSLEPGGETGCADAPGDMLGAVSEVDQFEGKYRLGAGTAWYAGAGTLPE